ncbi:hypothetical protein DH2020_034499 [Rehmannia glutinosa]|uniref:Reverse transcriptase domain-containing protein n=1 Tax=Rehmannia glutinosa TaxID=99300 RepID=A0ABR0V904_REHGL
MNLDTPAKKLAKKFVKIKNRLSAETPSTTPLTQTISKRKLNLLQSENPNLDIIPVEVVGKKARHDDPVDSVSTIHPLTSNDMDISSSPVAEAEPELRDFIRDKSPGLVFLCETKLSVRVFEKLKNSLGMFGISVPSVGRSGGLALLWKQNLDVSLRGFHERFIDAYVNLGRIKFRFTGVYGQPNVSERRAFWDSFKSLLPPTNEPWICIGDFNEVLQQHEFSGTRPRPPWQISLFRDAIEHCDLSDMGFFGPRYTWNRLSIHPFTQRGRLDRSLCNPPFRAIFPRQKVTVIPSFTSDHCLLSVHINPQNSLPSYRPKKRPIRFESYWIRSQDCKQVVHDSWLSTPPALNEKLQHCLSGLTQWSRKKFGDLNEKIQKCKTSISNLEKKTITPQIHQELSALHGQLNVLMGLNDLKWKQRAKQHWYKNGDRNTSFFHAHASKRRDINHISMLSDNSGQTITEPAAIERTIVDYFEDIFSSVSPSRSDMQQALGRIRPRVTSDMADCLTQPYTIAEVVKAVKSMHPFKSPGPDGMSPIFFQKFWPIVGNDVATSVLDFLNKKTLISDLNSTHIVLIPKIKEPKLVSHFRPISLCNGRTSGKQGLMSIKLDMSKAFDRIEWPFAIAALQALGFPPPFIDLIRICIYTPTFSFLLNGSQFGSVKPHRGIRQGDPISPYIFIICAEVFSCILQDLQAAGKIHGIRINKHAPSVSHLFFADDTLLFGRATIEEATHLKFAINLFEQASGQRINFDKSGILFSPNTDHGVALQIAQILGIPIVSSHEKYLGLPSVIGKNKREVFRDIQDRVWKRIQGWKEKTLSQAGREILIKAVIQSIPTYAMSCFRLPDNILHKIQSMAAQFFWGGSENDRKLHWVSWNKIARSKDKGGLGFRHLRAFNLALLAKQAWRLLTQPSNLLSRILRAKYFPAGSFLDANLGSRPSWSWRSILESRVVLSLGARKLVRSGRQTRIWTDPWIPLYKFLATAAL